MEAFLREISGITINVTTFGSLEIIHQWKQLVKTLKCCHFDSRQLRDQHIKEENPQVLD